MIIFKKFFKFEIWDDMLSIRYGIKNGCRIINICKYKEWMKFLIK